MADRQALCCALGVTQRVQPRTPAAPSTASPPVFFIFSKRPLATCRANFGKWFKLVRITGCNVLPSRRTPRPADLTAFNKTAPACVLPTRWGRSPPTQGWLDGATTDAANGFWKAQADRCFYNRYIYY
jgi:hypothetical protein